ncbi:transmembrane and coiled-coil domains protein 1 isoform X2 [Sardina pilchardus]|uniref:transmembrane and coiled-coil domains protein 1 isoform X2 n=1 Tax=Sardina pilchardus TaxID=27697 RepID=UPI002E13FFEE
MVVTQACPAASPMRRGATLPSRHRPRPGPPLASTGGAADVTDGPPVQRGSPQQHHAHRRVHPSAPLTATTAGNAANASSHDAPQQPSGRPRSSSTDGLALLDTPLSSGYQSTEETDRIERLEGGVQAALAGAGDISDEPLDPQRTRQVIAQLQQKILKLTEQLRIEQTARDENVAEYLKLANNTSDKQQSVRIKQVFEKKNQKSAGSIAQLQRKLEHYHRRLREAEGGAGAGAGAGTGRQGKAVLRDMQQGLRDVGARVSEFSEGVVDSVRGGLTSIQQVTHQAASKPREIASLLLASRHRSGSADNLHQLRDGQDVDTNGDESVLSGGGGSGGRLQASPKFGSEEDCSSGTSGSAGANSTTGGAPGGPPSSKGNTLERGQHSGLDMLLQEVQELREAQGRMEEALDGLKSHYTRDYTLILQGIQEERFRCERLEEQLNDLTELHQNEILNLKQELSSMEEKIAYQSNERARDIQEALEACQTRVSKMELQQQQQQVVQLEGLESAAAARTLLGKLISVLLALMAVLLVFVSAVANCVVPLMRTRGRSLSTLLFLIFLAFVWRNWDVMTGQTQARVHLPR